MDELAWLMDWDLEAIVRGCDGEASAAAAINMDDPLPIFSHFCSEQDEKLCSFPEFSETTKTKVFDELEELYKPFYPVLHPLSTQTILTSSPSIPKESEDFKILKASEKVTIQDLVVPTGSKCKRSKNKNKNKVVKQVTAANSVCDAWAWRKYGQKPIKGSPYPRSYYRCSSSKGCLARKQVERSHLDPSVFLVTYTAEHNHPYPTRRSSLAGSTRKNNLIVAPPRSSSDQNTSSSSSSSSEVVLMKSVQQSKGLKKEDELFEFLDEVEGVELLGDGWFSSIEIEELIGFDQELALDDCVLLDS